jgi:hypothetical protein
VQCASGGTSGAWALTALGWNPDAPNEVALLRNVMPGDSFDKVSTEDWQELVINTPSTSAANLSHDTELQVCDRAVAHTSGYDLEVRERQLSGLAESAIEVIEP